MSLVYHLLEHVTGACGEKHLSVAILLQDWASINTALHYLKHKLTSYGRFFKAVVRS